MAAWHGAGGVAYKVSRASDRLREAGVRTAVMHASVRLYKYTVCRPLMHKYATVSLQYCRRRAQEAFRLQIRGFETVAQCAVAQRVGFLRASDMSFRCCGRASSVLPNGLSCDAGKPLRDDRTCFPVRGKGAFCRENSTEWRCGRHPVTSEKRFRHAVKPLQSVSRFCFAKMFCQYFLLPVLHKYAFCQVLTER